MLQPLFVERLWRTGGITFTDPVCAAGGATTLGWQTSNAYGVSKTAGRPDEFPAAGCAKNRNLHYILEMQRTRAA